MQSARGLPGARSAAILWPMSARFLSVLPSWMLALLVGLGPLGAEVLAALGHAQVCACCRESEARSCCGGEEQEPEAPQVVAAQACTCAIVAPSGAKPCTVIARTSESRPDARSQIERLHRGVELAWVELAVPAVAKGSSLATPSPPGLAGPPGSRGMRGGERAAALGVLRI